MIAVIDPWLQNYPNLEGRAVMKLSRLIRLIGFALVAAAVTQELQKPREEREWHGKVGGVVPYDFRVPTLERIREAYWNPDDPRIFTDKVLGVGWAINFAAVVKRVQEVADQCCGKAA